MRLQIEASEDQFVKRLEQFRKDNLGAAKVGNSKLTNAVHSHLSLSLQ